MKLDNQKRLAAKVLKCSPKRVVFDNERAEELKEAITKADIRRLIIDKAISKLPARGVSRARALKTRMQKSKGRRKGFGSRKGTRNARLSRKEEWVNAIRKQRLFLKVLKSKNAIDIKTFREMYAKSKGGFFRSKRHIKIYLEESGLLKKQ